jgi:DNA replication and repair protein RecF
MTFSSLRIASFRNLRDAEIDIQGRNVFLVGENGQGKTNFLEALYFCSYASSFRGVRDTELIRTGEKNCAASVQLEGSLYNQILVKIENNKKIIHLDGKWKEGRKELLSAAPCIVFCHDDMEFVAGTPERRRWFFDQTQSLYDLVYLEDLQRYRKILKTKNNLLKAGRDHLDTLMLDTLDPQLAEYGLKIMEKREKAARRFSEIFGPLYERVSGIAAIEVRYIPSWRQCIPEDVRDFLRECRERDAVMGVSLSGPHRDRYVFTRNGLEFAGKASTGQQRLLALLLRIAQAHRYSESTCKNPVLLLDDVLLELDPEKRRKFLSVMPTYDQAFYTFLPEEPVKEYGKDDALIYHVANGVVSA